MHTQVWGLKQVALWLFAKPCENFFPGVKKFVQQSRLIRYRFLSELVGEMTAERYNDRLGGSGFQTKYRLIVFIIADSKVIKLEGAGEDFYGLPRIIFSDGEAHLEVPYDLKECRDWDDVALEMASLFGKPKGD